MSDLQPFTFPSPGFFGLNKEAQQRLLTPEWATEAQNAVIDEAGRMAARKGYTNLTSSAMGSTPTIRSLHEYLQNDGTAMIIAGAGNKLWHSIDDGANWVDKTAALTVTGDKWQFANFNTKVLAAQVGHALLVKSTTGNFALATAATGTLPINPVCMTAAFGRLWAVDSDFYTLRYSALMDDTKWATADGGGTLDLRYLWTQGTDQAIAIKAYGSNLVIFGKRHIFIYTDGRGSDRGLDPSTMYIRDTIEGQGCVARDSVSPIGEGDLVFLSNTGVRSMSRVEAEQAQPFVDMSGNNQTYVTGLLLGSNVDQTETVGVYSPENKFYLITTENANVTFCFDMRGQLEDNTHRVTEWTEFKPTALARRRDGTLLFGWAGKIGKYYGYLDDTSTYNFVYQSGWIDQGEANAILKMMKRLKVIAYCPKGLVVTMKWFYDFKQRLHYKQVTLSGDGPSEYATGVYGTAEYAGGLQQRTIVAPMSGSGQYVKLGVECTVNGQPFAIQSLTAYGVGGRLA